MRDHANKRGRIEKQWATDDLVRLQVAPTKGRKERKLMLDYEGPYRILSRDNEVEYTIQKVGEGKKIKLQVHANRLATYEDMMELDTREAKEEEKADSEKEDYDVEKIIAHKGSIKSKNKKYLVRWKGWGEEHDSWLPMADLVHCAELVQEYELQQVGVYSILEYQWDKGIHVVGTPSKTVAMNLNGTETADEVIDKICREADIRKEDIVLMWASPPCETYSRAN